VSRLRVVYRQRYTEQEPHLAFDGAAHEIYAGGENIKVADWLLKGTPLRDVRIAGERILRHQHGLRASEKLPDDVEPLAIWIVSIEPEEFWEAADDDDAVLEVPCELLVSPDGVTARATAVTDAGTSRETVVDIATRAAAILDARLELQSVQEAWNASRNTGWYVDLSPHRRGVTAEAIVNCARAVVDVIESMIAGPSRRNALALVRAGYGEFLVGQEESDWLEAKAAPWDLETEHGKIELGQDVARFANAGGGLIVVGASTRRTGDLEKIVRVRGLASGAVSARRVVAVVNQRVYPLVEGMAVFSASLRSSKSVLLAIDVPPQSDDSKPFVVHGAIVGSHSEGAFISIVRRQGEGSVTIGAREIHSWLVAGRKAMNRPRRRRS
jgi:hypothetical protein